MLVGSDLVLCIGEAVLLSVLWIQPREGFLIDCEIFSLSDSHAFDQDLLVDDPVHDTDRFLGGVEFAGALRLPLGRMGLHIGSQHGVDLGLVPGSLPLKPPHDIFIQP